MESIRMTDAGREARNRYNREWYAANKEKRAAINKRYWEKRAAKLAVEKTAARAAEKKASKVFYVQNSSTEKKISEGVGMDSVHGGV